MRNQNRKRSIFTSLMILGIFITSFISVQASTTSMQPISHNVDGIHVTIDPRIELLSIVQTLSTYDSNFGLITKETFSYKQDILDYFSTFSSHEAVKLFDEMSVAGFSYDAPPTAMLYLTDNLALDSNKKLDEYLLTRAGGREKLDAFISALNQFAIDSNFEKFYLDHQDFYKEMIEKNSIFLEGKNYLTELENYFGMKNNSYTIILAPMYHPGGFGPSIETVEGTYDLYSIQGPMQTVDNIPIFGNEQSFKSLVLHEFGHSFVNPLTKKHIEAINTYAKLYDPISAQMKQIAYSSWETSVNEHLLRAIDARRNYNEGGEALYKASVNAEKIQGFFYLEALAEKIAEYENNREMYKDFEAFYPEIIKVFETLSTQELGEEFYTIPFEGPINRALTLGGPTLLIMPTKEDPSYQQAIHTYYLSLFDLLKNQVGMDVTMVTDEEALKLDLDDKNIIVCGTIKGNLWLNQNKVSFPFQISKDKIVAGETYEGENLRLISALPHPTNKNKALLVYTAQQGKAIPNINSLFHGPTDYVIGEDDTVHMQGNYTKEDGKWTFSK